MATATLRMTNPLAKVGLKRRPTYNEIINAFDWWKVKNNSHATKRRLNVFQHIPRMFFDGSDCEKHWRTDIRWNQSKWHRINAFTTERRRKVTLPFMERNKEFRRQKYYRKKYELDIATKSREKYDSENLTLIRPSHEWLQWFSHCKFDINHFTDFCSSA